LVPDQRGYNRSEKPARVADYALPNLVSDVHELVKSTGRARCFLVGHDWGAAVAWETALRHPDMVARLCILNVPHPDVMTRFLLRSPRQMIKSWYIFAFQVPGLPEWFLLRNQCAGLRRMLKLSARPGTFSPADLDEYVRAWSQPGALTAMINWYRAVFRSAIRSLRNAAPNLPRRVSMPTLILWGEQDIALSKAMAQPSLDLCDQGRLITFPNATHWVQHDEAEAVSANLVAFLKS
jgi:pimeloyl-ACP methyl ester carboxylesterase